MYIRMRDADENGICRCFTCGKPGAWNGGSIHCGHGIPRQHWGTRYNEKNNHAQCVYCNTFNEGRKDRYMSNVDKKYGPGTWDLLNAMKNGRKLAGYQLYELRKIYLQKIEELKKEGKKFL